MFIIKNVPVSTDVCAWMTYQIRDKLRKFHKKTQVYIYIHILIHTHTHTHMSVRKCEFSYSDQAVGCQLEKKGFRKAVLEK
jgi:hypothetical protein